MKTILDLILEFAALNDAKMGDGGTLPHASEKRWAELKKFYDLLRAHNGISLEPVARRFNAAEIHQQVPSRAALRVAVEMDIAVEYQGDYHTAGVVNLSCRGIFLASETLWGVGSRLTLYLPNTGRGGEALLPIQGEVAWCTAGGIAEAMRPSGMGIRFIDLAESVREKLHSFVLETIEKQLCLLAVDALDPDFVRRENLIL